MISPQSRSNVTSDSVHHVIVHKRSGFSLRVVNFVVTATVATFPLQFVAEIKSQQLKLNCFSNILSYENLLVCVVLLLFMAMSSYFSRIFHLLLSPITSHHFHLTLTGHMTPYVTSGDAKLTKTCFP